MQRRSNIKPLLRAVSVMAIVIMIVSGVTFAALQSQQAVLSGNTIESASADLKISLNGVNYTSTQTGFDFSGVVPGGPAVPTAGYTFYLQNSGTTNSQVKMSVSTIPTNLNNIDLTKVSITVLRYPGGVAQTFTLANLISSYANGGNALTDILPSNTANTYHIQASMAADAFTGSGASLGNISFVFIGAAQAL